LKLLLDSGVSPRARDELAKGALLTIDPGRVRVRPPGDDGDAEQ